MDTDERRKEKQGPAERNSVLGSVPSRSSFCCCLYQCLSVFICGFNYRTNVNCAGPVPLAAWRYAIVSPA
jgi:hypothetical protein